jgi:23S rRNA (uridine2479-2'-O)-methyltransferase
VRAGTAGRPRPVTTRNADFQQWESLLTNRTKRLRSRQFVVQGVRPISMAIEHGWAVRALLRDERPTRSSWAKTVWESVAADHVVTTPELLGELGARSDGPPELIAVVEMPSDDLARIPRVAHPLVVVFDRPSNPGNIGTLIRSIDAFGGTALIVTGHAADPYDPRSVRATTGSLFAVPVIRVASHSDVLEWVEEQSRLDLRMVVAGTDEHGDTDISDVDLAHGTLLVVGNETVGLTTAWREHCDVLLKIPMTGAASSLNAATAGSVVLYEAMRQRRNI